MAAPFRCACIPYSVKLRMVQLQVDDWRSILCIDVGNAIGLLALDGLSRCGIVKPMAPPKYLDMAEVFSCRSCFIFCLPHPKSFPVRNSKYRAFSLRLIFPIFYDHVNNRVSLNDKNRVGHHLTVERDCFGLHETAREFEFQSR